MSLGKIAPIKGLVQCKHILNVNFLTLKIKVQAMLEHWLNSKIMLSTGFI